MPALSSPYSALLYHASRFAGEEPWLFRTEGLDWRWHSWGEVARLAAGWAGHFAGRPSGSRVPFPCQPGLESIALDLGIMGAGLVSVPVSGEGETVGELSEVPLPGPLITPTLFSHRPPPNREKREQDKNAPGVPLSRGGGWGGRERGRGEGLGWWSSDVESAPTAPRRPFPTHVSMSIPKSTPRSS